MPHFASAETEQERDRERGQEEEEGERAGIKRSAEITIEDEILALIALVQVLV